MAVTDDSSGDTVFTKATPILGLKLYAVIIGTVLLVLAIFLIILLIVRFRKSKRRRIGVNHGSGLLPLFCREISEINEYGDKGQTGLTDYEKNKQAIKLVDEKNKVFVIDDVVRGVGVESERKKGSMWSNESSTTRSESSSALSASNDGMGSFGWGRWFSLSELHSATNQFSDGNVVGEGGYGMVYRGVLQDGSVIAVKKLLNKNRGQAEREFKVEVETIGKVRHKNLVGLLGYCADGAQRLLVYEYIDNGNLEQWLHGDVGSTSPLTWDIRIKIAIGTARGLAYLHEGLEPKVVHRDVKSSNILLDKKWNPKVSDFGLAKLLGSEKSFVTTRVMGTFGYVSPDYASTGMLNEGNDVYSFGVLLMEIVTGRSPVDYTRPPGEMNLVDWFKAMVGNRRVEELVDPLIDEPPPPRSLKRILLLCLRCIDVDPNRRPKMGQIVHMLEAEEFPYRAEPRTARETAPLNPKETGISKIRSIQEAVNDKERHVWR